MLAQSVTAVALVLLGTSGVAKVIDPVPTGGALRAAHLPSDRWPVKALGVAEATAAVLGLSLGEMFLLPSALLYLGFTLFTLAAVLNRIPVQSCGCFGREDTPPSWIHVTYNTVATLALASLAFTGGSTIPWAASLTEVILYLGLASAGAYGSYLVLSLLPQTLNLAKGR